jgi:methylated-DNA-[protein]-cysteine S-methyltransferase
VNKKGSNTKYLGDACFKKIAGLGEVSLGHKSRLKHNATFEGTSRDVPFSLCAKCCIVCPGCARRKIRYANKIMRTFERHVIPGNPSNLRPTALFSAVVHVPFGAIGIRAEPGAIREMVYLQPSFDEKVPSDRLSEQAVRQIERYLEDPDFRFDLPLVSVGTEFQRRVWSVISSIPRGEVQTYGQVAKRIKSAPRAVGQACGANWYPLVIPCHRVTASGGIGGFSNHDDETGFHLGVKRWLLAHEGVTRY